MGLGQILRGVLIILAMVGLASWGWRHRNDAWIQGLWRPSAPPKAIQFDNGSVRDIVPRLAQDIAADGANGQAPQNLPGVMKKCVRKAQIVYTDQPCPVGFNIEQVSNDKVTVMAGGTTQATQAKAPPSDARKTLHDALDLSGNDNIKEKMMERAINR